LVFFQISLLIKDFFSSFAGGGGDFSWKFLHICFSSNVFWGKKVSKLAIFDFFTVVFLHHLLCSNLISVP